jgi:hypothetical protein
MGASILKRLLIALVAVAFIGANPGATCVGASAMQNTAAMTAPMDNPCADCLGNAPVTELAKMACGALGCAGIVGLPTRQAMLMPDFGRCVHPSDTANVMAGISLKPDPFPPKPSVRA